MAIALSTRERRWLAACILLVVAVRVATLGAYPLMDTTEARYAEIARKMLETGDWLMPQFDYGVPFWGKPPLSTWLAAATMAAFGVNEFAARLPSLALLAGCAALVHALAALRGGADQARWSLALFVATALVFVSAGGVMTDPALALGTTLAMAGFWTAVHGDARHRRLAGAGFFAGLAIGLLAKGPVAVVLTFVPLAAATVWTRSWRAAWQHLPWIGGSIAATLVTLAWYWAAERASPGFLDYFLVGEHWKRFVEPGWKGDLYGSAHARPRGTIWAFWIAAALPWSIGALAWLVRSVARGREGARAFAADPWRAYLLLWAATPMLFFTMSGNILVTYVLPGLPAFALLVGDLWRPGGAGNSPPDDDALRPAIRQAVVAAAIGPVLLVAGLALLHGSLESERSQKALVRDYERARGTGPAHLVYFPQRPHSAEFYSRGTAARASDAEALRRHLDGAPGVFCALRERDLRRLADADRARLQHVGAYGEWRLLRALPRR